MHTVAIEPESERRVAFLIYGYGLGNSPSLINAAILLVKHGFCVDLFTYATFLGNARFYDNRIQIHNIPVENMPTGATRFFSKAKGIIYYRIKLLSRFLPRAIQIENEERSVFKSIASFVKTVGTITAKNKYRCLIGVEPLGMMAAHQLSLQMNIPFAYYNMELHIDSDSITPNDFILKAVEKKFNKFASFTIAQDFERGRLIAQENGIEENSIIPVPVCAEGEAFKHKTSYLRDMFGLAVDTRIIIYAGFIADWAMCVEIAESAKSWPKNWVLIFHTHGYNDEGYIKKLRQFENSNLRFSLSPVTYEELPAFLASADIGITLYRDLGANFTLISSASGKLAHYLKSGLPVIVNSYPSVSKIVEQHHCGIAIDSPSQLREAIANIFENYEQMKAGAYQCYEEKYRLSRYFDKVVERIERL